MIRGGPATPREVYFSFDDMDATWHPNGRSNERNDLHFRVLPLPENQGSKS